MAVFEAAPAGGRAPAIRQRFWLFLALVISVSQVLGGHGQQPAPPEFVPGQVLVQFRQGVAAAAGGPAIAAASAVVGADSVQSVKADGSLQLLTTTLDVADAIRALQALPNVEFAQPNFVYRHFATSNDPYYTGGQLWGMYGPSTTPANQFGSRAGEAWAAGYTGSNTVYIGVIDEGVDFNHPDLAANVWTNPFDPVDGIDNDGNGRIDDIHGWDFAHNDNSVYDSVNDDHGTHVAGTIGAVGGNGVGVAGVVWNVKMISAKFLPGVGSGTTAAAIQAVDYITDLKTRHSLNIIATSNSWGGGGADTALHAAIIRGAKQGILFVAAAGNNNSNNDTFANYPSNYATNVAAGGESAASYDAVIAVAAIESDGDRSSFSNYGATQVDLGAPGTDIWSTTPANSYASYNGTSMATPHVSGAVALYKSINPNATAEQIRTAILAQVTPTPSMNGFTVTGGRLNVSGFAPVTTNMTINDVSQVEGQSGTSNFNFTVSLSETSPATVTANFATANGTATAGGNTNTTVTNSASTSIPDSGNGTPFPSNITIPSGLGPLSKVTATLTGFSHTFPSDVDIMLVGPNNQGITLLSGAGGGTDISNVTLMFDDAGSAAGTGALSSQTYRPTNLETSDTWPSPAPTTPSYTTLAGFNGLDPAGVWKLFVRDDAAGDSGVIASWSLTVSTPGTTGDYNATSGTVTFSPGQTSKTITVVVNGDATIEPSETFMVNLSSASFANLTDAQGIATILSDDQLPFTDPTLTAGTTMIKVVHITELRTRINAVRVARGLSNFTFTDPTLTIGDSIIKAVHILEMRTALNAAYVQAGLPVPTYSAPTPAFGVSVLTTAITELRAAVQAIE
jgi:thermitase